jgi:hypothetical protein
VKFRLGDRGFGIPLSQVREIAVAERVSPVPLAPRVVRGITALRGHVVTLLDVSAIFELPLPPDRSREDRLMVILDEPHEHLGLYVHGPVEIGRAIVGRDAPVAAAAPLVMLAAAGGRGQAGALEEGSDEPGGAGEDAGSIVHLLSASDLVAFCDARVLEGFRRKA